MSVGLFITHIVLILFSQICALISMTFVAIVKANTFNSYRAIKGLIYFAVYYFVSMLATLLIAVIVFALAGNLNELFATTMSQGAFIGILVYFFLLK